MSILGRIVSAAVVAGATLAVGACAKKISEKVSGVGESKNPETEFIGEADSEVSLLTNPSAGFSWKYKMSKSGVVKEIKNETEALAPLDGSKAVQRFDFAPVSDGICELEFDYIKANEAPFKTITYTFEVKDKKIVRCNAAGDLECAYKEN